jgi:hypothetical protein
MKEITKALVKFHMEVGKIKKDANNPFFKSKYASLSNILDVVTPVLVQCDLNIIQMPVGDGYLKTILSHVSGETIEPEPFNMKITKNDPQSMGSAITYARRYAIGAILNLNIEEDDDGNRASTVQDTAQVTAQADDKKWLNACDKTGNLNDRGKRTALALVDGRTDWDKLTADFKISKKEREALNDYVEHLKAGQPEPTTEPMEYQEELLPF